MKLFKYLTINLLGLTVLACSSCAGNKSNDFSIKTNAEKGNISIGKALSLSIENKKGKTLDSIHYILDGKRIDKNTILNNHKLGKYDIEALIYSENEKQSVKTTVTILNNEAPKIYTYKIINQYPHDITSYTQGLEFFKGKLYESTGQYNESKLRELDYKTGKIVKNIVLPKEYFGEGLTILNDKLYQLTWKEGVGLVYNIETLEKTGSFKYGKSKEGWGLCNDNTKIYKSDGTEDIWILNPITLAEEEFIQVYTNKGKIIGINEMEWVNGEIYANRYQKDGVAIINPKNGAVTGVIDFSPLKKLVTQHEGLDVLNGIAYNQETKTLFVTGKRWDKLFEVEIIEK
ncbi:MAG: glutaminyl-peptide cyclotransferase [Aestuariibaculum sp.]